MSLYLGDKLHFRQRTRLNYRVQKTGLLMHL